MTSVKAQGLQWNLDAARIRAQQADLPVDWLANVNLGSVSQADLDRARAMCDLARMKDIQFQGSLPASQKDYHVRVAGELVQALQAILKEQQHGQLDLESIRQIIGDTMNRMGIHN